jgi:hypothetical protein
VIRRSIFHGRFLRPENSLLQNSAIQRNAARISLAMIIPKKHAVQSGETTRNSLGLNYNQLLYLG